LRISKSADAAFPGLMVRSAAKLRVSNHEARIGPSSFETALRASSG
jgi:hypothetical protein